MSIQPSKQAVLHAYRSLLKTQKQVFASKILRKRILKKII